MVKICLFLMIGLLLGGCSAEPTFETLEDDHVQSVMQEERSVLLQLPEDAEVIHSDAGVLYLCEGFEVTSQVLPGGNLEQTVQLLTGFPSEKLTVMVTDVTDYTRYACVWSAAGEGGDTVGRAVILDDGVYHYCLTMTASASVAAEVMLTWQQILSSYALT